VNSETASQSAALSANSGAGGFGSAWPGANLADQPSAVARLACRLNPFQFRSFAVVHPGIRNHIPVVRVRRVGPRSTRAILPYAICDTSIAYSFLPAPCFGECLARCRDTASIPSITPASKFRRLNSTSIMSQMFCHSVALTKASMPRSARISTSRSANRR
jgi:hypothetical protein